MKTMNNNRRNKMTENNYGVTIIDYSNDESVSYNYLTRHEALEIIAKHNHKCGCVLHLANDTENPIDLTSEDLKIVNTLHSDFKEAGELA